ncbi:MAG: cellulase family glycosylhydrolase, partial [Proteiniphilum sp.]
MKQIGVILTIILLICLLAGYACGGEEGAPDSPALNLKLKESSIELKEGESIVISIVSGNGGYKVFASPKEIVTVTADSKGVSITALKEGTATVTVTDEKDKSATIKVKIMAPPSEVPQNVFKTKILRGFDIASVAGNDVLEDVIEKSGANLIRLMFSYRPLVNKNPPYNFNEEQFENLRRIVDWCEENNVHVVIDPHTTPGTRDGSTIYPDDEFWKDAKWQEHLMKVWIRIANEYKDRGDVIAGYDLLNEPAVPSADLTIWNDLVADLTKAIRETGDKHTIIVEACGSRAPNGAYVDRIPSLDKLVLPDDPNLVVSPHFYDPLAFTHQGVIAGYPVLTTTYPGVINGVNWNKERISQELQPVRDFSNRYPDVPIYIGEFSTSRISGPAGDT